MQIHLGPAFQTVMSHRSLLAASLMQRVMDGLQLWTPLISPLSIVLMIESSFVVEVFAGPLRLLSHF